MLHAPKTEHERLSGLFDRLPAFHISSEGAPALTPLSLPDATSCGQRVPRYAGATYCYLTTHPFAWAFTRFATGCFRQPGQFPAPLPALILTACAPCTAIWCTFIYLSTCPLYCPSCLLLLAPHHYPLLFRWTVQPPCYLFHRYYPPGTVSAGERRGMRFATC